MKKMVTLSIAALMSTATLGLATPAAAQNGYYSRDGYSSYDARYNRDNRRYDRRDYRNYDRRDYRNYDRRDNRNYRNYRQCDNGTGGTIIGAIAGGLLGRTIDTHGDRTVGTVLGAGAGALAGHAIDRSGRPGYCR